MVSDFYYSVDRGRIEKMFLSKMHINRYFYDLIGITND